jgi:hypothetical protein
MKRIIFLISLLFVMVCTQANADLILLDNLGQSPANLWNSGSTIGQAFVSGSGITINSATFMDDYGGYVPSSSAYLTIQNATPDGKIGSTVYDTWSTHSTSGSLVTYFGTYTLSPNTNYWLVINDTTGSVARVSSSTAYTANFGASLPLTNNNYESSTGVYYSLAEGPLMFQVTAVPIPAAIWLLGSGLVGLFGIRRRFTS